jgi:hypothetical protein
VAQKTYILRFQDIAVQRAGFIIFDGFQSMVLSALSVFEYANITRGKALYEVRSSRQRQAFLMAAGL